MIWAFGYVALGCATVFVLAGVDEANGHRYDLSLGDLALNVLLWPLTLFCTIYDP